MAAQTNVGVENKKSMIKYFRDVKAEFKKITWPTLNDVKDATIKTLVVMLFFTLVVTVYDSIFSNILKSVLNYLK